MDDLITIARPHAGPPLPGPRAERFQPLRIGVVNVWQYDCQEWWLENGWLLLRGDNGAGKTKVLELTLPFLLDGQLRSERLDSWGEQGRTMKWNLLEDRVYEQRAGYAWIEFGRRIPNGNEEFVTIGAWLRASASKARAEADFFVTSERVGEGVHLPRPGEPALSKEGLKRQVGELYETAHEYRAAVDAALFGLGLDRYRDLVNLLLQLRRPKLSSSLKPSGITRLLSDSLPPIDEVRITDLANMFEQLDGYQRRKAELTQSLGAVDEYLRYHRTFVRRQLRKAAESLRQANSDVEGDAERLAEAKRALDAAKGKAESLSDEQAQAADARNQLAGKLEAQRSSPAMKAAERLEKARLLADQAKGRWEDAAGRLREREGEHAQAEKRAEAEQKEHDQAESEHRRLLAGAETAAAGAGVQTLFEAAVAGLLDDVEAGRRRLTALAGSRHNQVAEVRVLDGKLGQAAALLEQAQQRVGEAGDDREAAAEKAQHAERALAEARQTYSAEIAAWAGELRQLVIDAGEREALSEAAVLREEFGSAAPRLLAGHERRRAEVLNEEMAAARATLERIDAVIATVDADRERLLAERELAPPVPATRTADRSGRPGAPFYRLVDFDATLAPAERAGLEAALEASGLLDAWVSPGGEVLDPGTFDTFLPGGGHVASAALIAALHAVPNQDVAVEVVASVLGRIGLGESDAASWVSTDGSWRLGVLTGRGEKPEPHYVGAAARERHRERRLREMADRRAALEAQRAEAGGAVAAVARAHEELTEEVRRFPPDRQVGERADALHKALLALDQAEGVLVAARAAEARARDDSVRALNERDARARQLDLVADLDDLDGLDRRIDQYRDAAISLSWAADKLRAARQRLAREVGERDRLREMVANNRVDAEERRAAWLRVQAEADELAASPEGLAATEALERVEALRVELASLGSAMEAREASLREANVALGAAQQRVGGLEEKHGESVERRESAASGLISLIREGALAIGLDPELDGSGDWSMTRALEVARQRIAPELGGEPITPQSMDNARTRLTDAFRELTAMLAAYAPSLEWHLDGRLPSTTAVYNDRSVSIIELRARVAAERAEQEELFNKAEADLIERYLLGEVADHLRERVMSAEGQVTAINRMLRHHRTASGLYLSLRWSRNVENARHQNALQSLMTDPSLLREDQRTTLREFFQDRIRGARDQGDNRTWRDHLLEALDYRQWFRLGILKHQDGRTELFSDREFTVGSGGEKSVSLHLPLFAAAAAYYDSAVGRAPRPVVLDEVFVGIDARMRGSCLEMVREFDLDLVMTSAEELGTYAEVPALGIYHMVRDHTVRGVLCEHWVWNGEELVERPE